MTHTDTANVIKALNGKTFLCDTGKVLGGTSARSFLWQIRLVGISNRRIGRRSFVLVH